MSESSSQDSASERECAQNASHMDLVDDDFAAAALALEDTDTNNRRKRKAQRTTTRSPPNRTQRYTTQSIASDDSYIPLQDAEATEEERLSADRVDVGRAEEEDEPYDFYADDYDGYPLNSRFIDYEKQTTNMRGIHENAAELERLTERTQRNDLRQMFPDAGIVSDDDSMGGLDEADIEAEEGGGGGGRGDKQPAPLTREDLQEDREFCERMINGIASNQITFVPSQLPKHRDQKKEQLERFRKDGITNIALAKANCPICGTDVDTDWTANLSPDKAKFVKLSRPKRKGDIKSYAKAANIWNHNLAEAANHVRAGSMPMITTSTVEIHAELCKKSLLLRANSTIDFLEDIEEKLKEEGVFVNKRVCGVPTNTNGVSMTGWKNAKEVVKEKREYLKLAAILEAQEDNRSAADQFGMDFGDNTNRGGGGKKTAFRNMGNGVAGHERSRGGR